MEASSGGLATGLRGPHEQSGGLWIGWPGDTSKLSATQRRELGAHLERLATVPIELNEDEIEHYYEGFANGVLWPLFHYLIESLPLRADHFDAYERVNERFADTIARHYRPGDLVWVHDYQLMLVPRLLRVRLPQARIGFFLHIPFPASEVFRVLPQREQLLRGLLGADLVGFHTASYMRHFASSLLRILGVGAAVDRVHWEDREVRLGAFPMGVDAARFVAAAALPDVADRAAEIRGPGGCRLMVAIDRLDYTKGIPRRLLAFEQLLRDQPALRERVRLIQLAVPSRTRVTAYRSFRREVDALIGRVNGSFATPTWTPIHYIYRNLSDADVAALYRSADVMLVTPIRDGMNLVAKEYVASRTEDDGVLVLSEFAGAAAELAEALQMNPYDIDRAASVFHQAMTMPESEQRARMRALRKRVLTYDVHRWARTYMDELASASAERSSSSPRLVTRAERDAIIARMADAPSLLLLLDYDGTLVPLASVPDLATPDAALLVLLAQLSTLPATSVHVISGRSRETLDRWLGSAPIGLHAEHGFWSRERDGSWTHEPLPAMTWRAQALAILEDYTARTPGSLIEEKTASLAWHYRMTEADFGRLQANELRVHLTQLLSNAPVEILTGAKVIEIRPHGANKSIIVPRVLAMMPPGTMAVAMGDDRTDEDLFAALPADGVAVHVGPGSSLAAVRLAEVADARDFLSAVVQARARPGPSRG